MPAERLLALPVCTWHKNGVNDHMHKFIDFWDRILGAYFKLAACVSVFIIVIATLFITAEIIARLFFNTSFQIVMQFSGYSLFIITFLSAGWVLREKSHIIIDFLVVKLKNSARQQLDAAVIIVCAITCIFLFIESAQYVIAAWERGLTTPYPFRLSTAYLLVVMPIGWLSMALEFILQAFKKFKNGDFKKKEFGEMPAN